ncbi:MAG: paraquat-inducible protein A [Epsilonproteobacteria bacterium]|nr:paraquat-inducible protein A [Campylobacterota bacterium]
MKILRLIIILPLIIMLGYFGVESYKHAKAYEEATASIAKQSDASGLAQGKLDKLTSVISFGLIEDNTKIKLDRFKNQQSKSKIASQTYLYYFMLTLVVLIMLSFTCTLASSTLILAIGSLISLIFGLINPILMVTIHKEVNHLGDVILSFESKGILGSISKLFESGENIVALTILLFSVIIPVLKITTLIFTLLAKEFNIAHTLVNFFKHLGKWSMVDVFVVATLLVYLSSNQGEVSHAEIQVGLYFFLAYVLLSMVTTIQTQKVLNRRVAN